MMIFMFELRNCLYCVDTNLTKLFPAIRVVITDEVRSFTSSLFNPDFL